MPTNIEWVKTPDGTSGNIWNPFTGCTKVSPGCKYCYAESYAVRFWKGRPFTDVRVMHERMDMPWKWKKPRGIFVNSMSGIFHEKVPNRDLINVFEMMRHCSQHKFFVLTKRVQAMEGFIKAHDQYHYLPNVFFGVSAETREYADSRIPVLMRIPVSKRFLSCEPLLGPLSIYEYVYGLNWVIVGGESGAKARTMSPAWVRSVRAQCREDNIPFFFKKRGARDQFRGKFLDGKLYNNMPIGYLSI